MLACYYAEEAKEIYERLGDRANYGRLLNNLGGLNFLLGKPEQAVDNLKQAITIALSTATISVLGHERDVGKTA